jgi:hypothetical protein
MSDLSDLQGVYPTSIRWNAETGTLGVSAFNSETGEHELQPIDFGPPATVAMDILTRERGYGMLRPGVYDVRLTPVGSPPPPWPGNPDFKPALGVWLWNPQYGDLRLETVASIFRTTLSGVWDRALVDPMAAEGNVPVIRFEGSVPVTIRAVGKTFQRPIIKIVGWVERDKVPGWSSRPPTVAVPKAPPLLTAAPSETKKPAQLKKGTKPVPDDPAPINDSIPGERR